MRAHETVIAASVRSRGMGNTQALIEGIKNWQGARPFVVTSTLGAAKDLGRRLKEVGAQATVVSISDDPRRLLGLPAGPVLVDMAAVEEMIREHQKMHAALGNMLALARPHFTDEVQRRAIREAEDAMRGRTIDPQ